MRRTGVGVIGAGKHGRRYLGHIHDDLPELELVAMSRHDPVAGAAVAQALGCRFHRDWRDLVADPRVEAVVAVVPPSLHLAIVSAVAGAGKALLIEKPLAVTGADAIDIVQRVRRTGIPCLMGHTLRWNAVVRTMRECLPELGPLRALALNQRFEPSVLAWLDTPEISGGGIILHTGVHSFDLVRHLTGCEVRRVWCRTRQARTARTEDNFSALLELDRSDTLVVVSGSRATLGRSGLIDVAGADGQLVGDHALGFAYAVRGLERTPLALPDPVPTVREALRAFVRTVRHGTTPPVTIEDGARAVLIAEACCIAASQDGAVTVAPLD